MPLIISKPSWHSLEVSLNGTEIQWISELRQSEVWIWAEFKDPLSHTCLAGTVVAFWSLTQEVAGSNPFDDEYF